MEIFFVILVAVVLCLFVYYLVRAIATWHKNNLSPTVTEVATVINKRRAASMNGNMTYITCYVTFKTQGGEELELTVKGRVFRSVEEGYAGRLTHKGTRFISFERNYM